MSDQSIRGRWAVVTGASSGLGVDFARELAQRGCHTVLVARRADRLQALAEELHRDYQAESAVIPLDLTDPDAPQKLSELISRLLAKNPAARFPSDDRPGPLPNSKYSQKLRRSLSTTGSASVSRQWLL